MTEAGNGPETPSNGSGGVPDNGRRLSVFAVSLVLCGVAAVFGIMNPETLVSTITAMTRYSLSAFDWAFLLAVTAFILLCFFLAFGRYGHVKLGRPEDEPEFNTISWITMLFAAGMGAGLLFWGVAEPLNHYLSPPPQREAMTPEAARWAMVVCNLHWGLHAWGIYAMGALVLGYFGFRRGYPLLASSPIVAVFPGPGGRVLGRVADVIAVLAVVFGLAGSLGMGVTQIRSGLAELYGTSAQSMPIALGILVALAVCYMISASTSIDKGIRFLSDLNMSVIVLLMIFVMLIGPTAFVLSTFVTSLGDYASSLVAMSFRLHPYSGENEWNRIWTLTYFIWWIAWAPFVGIFIARISRGRTIREFVLTVMFAPTLFSMLWFAVMGGTGLHLEMFGQQGLGSLALENPPQALYALLSYFPFSQVLAVVAMFLMFIFLVTSADSGSFVLGMMTSEGALNPSRPRKLLWGLITAALATAALFAAGGVHVMRAFAISGAIPFTIIMIVHAGCLLISLFQEALETQRQRASERAPTAATQEAGS